MHRDDQWHLPKELLVDFDEIDKQHAEIFSQLAALTAAGLSDDELPVAEFQHLVRLIERHFAAEEELAAQAALSFSGHAKVHRDNLQQMKDACDVVLGGISDPASFLRYIEFWFERHIVQYDIPFALNLKAISSDRSVV